MVNEPPKKCGICGEVIPFIPEKPCCSCPQHAIIGPARGHYDYANHHCSEEAMAAWSERMKKEHPELAPAARELAEKIETDFYDGVKKINTEFERFFQTMFGGGTAKLLVI